MGTIKYDIYENPNPDKEKKRYHVRVAESSLISYEEVKAELTHSSSVTPGDIDAVISGLCDVLVKEISNGRRVCFGELGYFGPSISMSSVIHPKEINASKIQLKDLNYLCTARLMKRIKEVTTIERATLKVHSVMLSKEEMVHRLRTYFQQHDTISLREFKSLMNLTQGTAYRRLCDFCKGDSPIMKRIGQRNSSVYVMV